VTGPDTTELLLASVLMMAGDDPNAVIGLLLSATVKACLLAEHPRGALEMAELVFAEARRGVERVTAEAAGREEPS
jgi:hypothetical protein